MKELKTERIRITPSERELIEFIRDMSSLTFASIYTSCSSCIKLEKENVYKFTELLKRAYLPPL